MTGCTAGARRGARRWLWGFIVWSVVIAGSWWVWPTRLGGATTLAVVQGNSMEPTYHSGDVLIARAQSDYKPGTIVVFKVKLPGHDNPTALVVHRLTAIGPDGSLTTQGDNRSVADGFTVTTADIVGRPVARIPHGGSILYLLSQWWLLAGTAGAITTASLWNTDQARTSRLPKGIPGGLAERKLPWRWHARWWVLRTRWARRHSRAG